MERNKNKSRVCQSAVELTIDVIGGKWKLLILHKIGDGRLRFSELRKLLPGMTTTMLTKQLRELERDGILIRTFYPEVPPRVEYSLSELGKSTLPLCLELCTWGNYYNEQTGHRYKWKK